VSPALPYVNIHHIFA